MTVPAACVQWKIFRAGLAMTGYLYDGNGNRIAKGSN